MTSTKPVTFVLVPGSFTLPTTFDKVVALLEAQNQTVKAIPLQTVNDGSRMPPATFADDVAYIRSEILSILDEDKRNVVLLLHSYSGLPGSSALSGLSKTDRTAAGQNTAVIGLVYLASFVPILGDHVRGVLAGEATEEFFKGTPGGYFAAMPPESMLATFNDVKDEAEARKYYTMMVRHASDSFSGEVTYEPWRVIESTTIIPGDDLIIAPPIQESMYERAVKEGGKLKRVFVKGGGHCLNVSRPELVVEEIMKMASH